MKFAGGVAMTTGAGMLVTGGTITVGSAGVGGVIGEPVQLGGLQVAGIGAVAYWAGDAAIKWGAQHNKEADAAAAKAATPTPAPAPTPEKEKTVHAPVVVIPAAKKEKEPKPEEPHDDDIYDDPYGGGTPNPNQLPDDGDDPGDPTMIWDDDDGGIDPTMIWDENGGGVGPKTIGIPITTRIVTGRGLLASIVQVGPATFTM